MINISLDQKFEELSKSISNIIDFNIADALIEEGLTKKDFLEIYRRLGRSPNRTELGMFGVMWSEHCCYRNSKTLLQNFPINAPYILIGPGENAGVIDIGEGQRLVFKIESHNHPSAIEPFQGAATGVGGILRDIFTMGARPIAILNALRFGLLDDDKNISLLEGVVAGIAHYGNCVGVPTIGGEISFDKSYTGNPLVNAMALGLIETNEIVKSGPKIDSIGFPVVYVGNTTGRDGMGGASFASAELTNSSLDNRPAVQVGDPFLEKGLIEACLEAFKNGEVIAAQDMGAAGLTCSSSEMAAKGNVGIELNLDAVPAREEGMTAYEYLLSESQERMLFVVKPGFENKLIERFTKWGLYVAVVGKVIKEKVVRVIHHKKIVANIPTSSLAEDTPIEHHNLLNEPPKYIQDHWKWDQNNLPKDYLDGILEKSNIKSSWNNILLKLLDNPSIASKSWVYNQYDYQVQSNTVLPPGIADAAVIRLRPQNDSNPNSVTSNRGIAAVVDCPNRWVYLDPERGSIAAVVESSRNLTCVGALPLAVTDNLNFASPERPEGYWQLALSCRGISKACRAINTPVTGGNVSLYNETKSVDNKIQPIQPTPVIGMVGLIDDLNNVVTKSWKKAGDYIYLIEAKSRSFEDSISLSGSAYLEYIHGLVTGRPPEINLTSERHLQSFIRQLISKKLFNSIHDISQGGLAIAIADCSISSQFGANIILEKSSERIDKLLFGEGGSRFVVSISQVNSNLINYLLEDFNKEKKSSIKFQHLGEIVTDQKLLINQSRDNLIDLPLSNLKHCFENGIPSRIKKQSSF